MNRSSSMVVLAAVVAGLVALMSSSAQASKAPEVTIDFSNNAQGDLDPLFYRREGLVFPPQRCGDFGCSSWFITMIQGDNAVVGNPLLGGVTAKFKRPISELSLRIAPGAQGTADYTLTVFSVSGEEIASQTLRVTQDEGEPDTQPFGYFTMSLAGLRKARSFHLTNAFVRSSFGGSGPMEFGVSSISYTPGG